MLFPNVYFLQRHCNIHENRDKAYRTGKWGTLKLKMDLTCLDAGLCQKIKQVVGLGHQAFWHGELYTSETHARTKVPQHEDNILRATSDGIFWPSFMQSKPENAQKAAQHLRIISLMPTWYLIFLFPCCLCMALHLTLSTSLICLFIFCFPKQAPYSNIASFSWNM